MITCRTRTSCLGRTIRIRTRTAANKAKTLAEEAIRRETRATWRHRNTDKLATKSKKRETRTDVRVARAPTFNLWLVTACWD